MKNLIYLIIVILLFFVLLLKINLSKTKLENGKIQKPAGSELSLTCDCTCDCNGKVFTITVYPCKNKVSFEKSCKQKCN